MKYGIREICDVVLKAKARTIIGDKVFYKDEPVIYFDSLKTSSMEGASTTVYAQGGKGNSKLVAWEGERTVTFTMEDALISKEGLALLTGAGIVEATATNGKKIYQHVVERAKVTSVTSTGTPSVTITLANEPAAAHANDFNKHNIYVMLLDANGNIDSEPYIFKGTTGSKIISLGAPNKLDGSADSYAATDVSGFVAGQYVLVDYYTARSKGMQIDIEANSLGGNYYLEASTLFRDTNGVDLPAEFIIPNCRIQSNFTFSMASSGDPTTFTFTLDAFPDYTRWDPTKKVLSAIQILDQDLLIDTSVQNVGDVRTATDGYTSSAEEEDDED